MKVVFVGGAPCEFCGSIQNDFPDQFDTTPESDLVEGRVYTVIKQWHLCLENGIKGTGYRLAEYQLEENWGHCSCQFRDVEGDAGEWRKLLREHKHKPKVLEPC